MKQLVVLLLLNLAVAHAMYGLRGLGMRQSLLTNSFGGRFGNRFVGGRGLYGGDRGDRGDYLSDRMDHYGGDRFGRWGGDRFGGDRFDRFDRYDRADIGDGYRRLY